MKVLYIGNYKDGTGWGNAAMHNIRALNFAGIDVVPRYVSYSGNPDDNNCYKDVLELEKKNLKNVDVCIQHVLPTDFFYSTPNPKWKNVCMFETENTNYRYSQWHKYINMFDNLFIPNSRMKDDAWHSGVEIYNKKIHVVNHCLDTELYKNFQPTEFIDIPGGHYTFCFVGEMNKRKNISAIIKAFHKAFHPSENINLFLKLSGGGFQSNQDAMSFFNEFHTKLTNSMKIRNKYKEPYVVFGRLPHQTLLSYMSQCHCFVCASYGEAWCIPALEAGALGLNTIYTNGTGLSEFVYKNTVESKEVSCFDALDTLPELSSSHDSWMEIDIDDLSHKMRLSYDKRKMHKESKNFFIENAMIYNYERTGRQFVEALNDIV